jgi:hypothetical protein
MSRSSRRADPADRRILAWLTQADPGPEPVPDAPAPSRARVEPLTDGERAAVMGVSVAVGGIALIGFVNSFEAVMSAAWPFFGVLAPTVPLGIDLGIAVFAALDLVLARIGMRLWWVRMIPWALTAATVWLNVEPEHAWFARIAHGVLPALWVLAVEVGAHVIRTRANLASDTSMDRVRTSRWLLAPLATAALWRRMVLWEIRSYPLALCRERDRLLARTTLQDEYGLIAWRWKAPRRVRALYRLGELVPASAEPLPADAGTAPALPPGGASEPASASAPAGASGGASGSRPAAHPKRTPKARPRVQSKRTPAARPSAVTDEDAEMHYATDITSGRVPAVRRIQRDLHVGQKRAGEIRAHLLAIASVPETATATATR